MIEQIKAAAESVGIVAVVTNSKDRLETQLNSLTREEDAPLMLVSWDMEASIEFGEHGIIKDPYLSITSLLVQKPEELTKESAEDASEEMAQLFFTFLQTLYINLSPLMRDGEQPITQATFQYVPLYGAGKHSGIMAKWRQRKIITPICNG